MSHGVCERCGESLDGDEIPGLRGRRRDLRIPVELTYKYRDVVVIYRCPFCGFGWPRFEAGTTPMYDDAVNHLAGDQQQQFERTPNMEAPGRARPSGVKPLPDVDPDRRVAKVKGLPVAPQPPAQRCGVQRAGARTGTRHQPR